jgi:SAM-dependent methyltransferase
LITRRRLLEILDPMAGERMLEVGPGTGYYTLPVAARLEPAGTLEILYIRRGFLDQTVRRAHGRGLTNVVATLGGASLLPYASGCFDAAYLVTVLGEIPDPDAALGEMRRELKPAGRLVVGEILIDPDFTTLSWLVNHARAIGLRLERRTRPPGWLFRQVHGGGKRGMTAPPARLPACAICSSACWLRMTAAWHGCQQPARPCCLSRMQERNRRD